MSRVVDPSLSMPTPMYCDFSMELAAGWYIGIVLVTSKIKGLSMLYDL